MAVLYQRPRAAKFSGGKLPHQSCQCTWIPYIRHRLQDCWSWSGSKNERLKNRIDGAFCCCCPKALYAFILHLILNTQLFSLVINLSLCLLSYFCLLLCMCHSIFMKFFLGFSFWKHIHTLIHTGWQQIDFWIAGQLTFHFLKLKQSS